MLFPACILNSVHINPTRLMLQNSPENLKIKLKILSSKQCIPQVQSQNNINV